jgi:ribosomal protein S18 acetylase RimI-like enzyme
MANEILIIEYQPSHYQRFKEINVQWITRNFLMEEEDQRTVDDPEGYILNKGGKIYIAFYKGQVVGTCAYLNFGDNVFEMIKMAVDENYRGLKIGKLIGEISLQKMKESGAKKIFLFSNKKGSSTAIALYRKLGFTEIPLGDSEFQRADIKMELIF